MRTADDPPRGDGRPDAAWADEFAGPAGARPAGHWRLVEGGGGWGNGELQTYTSSPANVGLDGAGHLRITARRDARGSWTSARLESRTSFTEGLLEARIRVPAGQGLWSAFWTLGADHERAGWPAAGEIDVLETRDGARSVQANVHLPDDVASDGQWQRPGSTPLSPGWHVFAVRRTADALAFSVDGDVFHRVRRADAGDRPWPFDRPQVVLLNIAVGGTWPGPPDASTPAEASMLVDWVRVRD